MNRLASRLPLVLCLLGLLVLISGLVIGRVGPARAEALVKIVTTSPGGVVPVSTYYRAFGAPAAPVLPPLEAQKRAVHGDRLTVPALHAALPIVTSPVKNGAAQLPGGVGAVGWLNETVQPTSAHGTSVLMAHRDSEPIAGHGTKSPLANLAKIKRGQRIEVRWNGHDLTYVVDKIQRLKGDRLPPKIMNKGGEPRLVVITCGEGLRYGPHVHGMVWAGRDILWTHRV